MGIRIGSGLSTEADARFGAAEAAAAARDALGGRECDLAVVFASGAHLAAPEATLEGIHETLAPAELVGCGAAGVIGEMREVEQGTAVSVWAAALDGGEAMPFHAEVEALGSDEGVLSGLPDLTGAAGALLLPIRSRSRPTRCCASSRPPRRCCRCSEGWRRPARPTPRRRSCSGRTS